MEYNIEEINIEEINRQLRLALLHLTNAQKDGDLAGVIDAMELGHAHDCISSEGFRRRNEIECNVEELCRRLRLALLHLRNAQKDTDLAGLLDAMELGYAHDCIAVALRELNSRGPAALAS